MPLLGEIDDHLRNAHRWIDAHEQAPHRARPDADLPRRAVVRRILSRSAGVIDDVTLKVMEPIFLSGDKSMNLQDDLQERVQAFHRKSGDASMLANPERFYRKPAHPDEFRVRPLGTLRRGVRLKLTFRSTYRTFDPDYSDEYLGYESNRIARARLWLHNDAHRPTIVCVHPWCLGYIPFDKWVFRAQSLYKLGLNVALFTMPFHGTRTPKGAFPGMMFPSRNVQRTNEAFGQAVADLRVLMDWLRQEQNAGPIGMTGFSLGGYTTALMASLCDDIAFAIPIIAPSTFADLMWFHGSGRRQRKAAEDLGVTLWDLRGLMAIHSPLVHQPRVPRERTLIVWGAGDRIVPSVHQLALWEHWGRPEIRSYPGSHMLHIGRFGYFRDINRWLKKVVL